jgi:hypothetical protein
MTYFPIHPKPLVFITLYSCSSCFPYEEMQIKSEASCHISLQLRNDFSWQDTENGYVNFVSF